MKVNKLLMIGLGVILSQCSHPNQSVMHEVFAKEKVNVNFTSFFDSKSNREIENLEVKLEVAPPRTLSQPLKQGECSVKYDKAGEEKTVESLNRYLNELKDFTRYIFDFSFDSIKCKVFSTEKFDITHIIMLNKYNSKYHFINESFFVYGTVLKIADTNIKSNNGDFNDVITEKITTSLFDQNKLFSKTEEKYNKAEHALKYSDDEAFQQMQDAFLLRQFCRDALLKLKDAHPDWFE